MGEREIINLIGGIACWAACLGLTFQHVTSSPKRLRWPPKPTAHRLIILATAVYFLYRGLSLLVFKPAQAFPFEGLIGSVVLAAYFGAQAMETLSKRRTSSAQIAVTTFEALADDPKAPPAKEILTRGVVSAMTARSPTTYALDDPQLNRPLHD